MATNTYVTTQTVKNKYVLLADIAKTRTRLLKNSTGLAIKKGQPFSKQLPFLVLTDNFSHSLTPRTRRCLGYPSYD